MTVEAARQPGRSPRRPGAAAPQFRHQSCSGSIGAPHRRHASVAAGVLAGCSGGLSRGASGAASGARTGSASSSFTCPGLHTLRATRKAQARLRTGCGPRARSGAGDLEAQRGAVDRRAVHGLDDALGVAERNAEEREVLEYTHVAHGLAVDARGARHSVHEIGDLDALGAADAGDQLGLRLVAVAREVGLRVPARASCARLRPTA